VGVLVLLVVERIMTIWFRIGLVGGGTELSNQTFFGELSF
jgi:hypothetical protein